MVEWKEGLHSSPVVTTRKLSYILTARMSALVPPLTLWLGHPSYACVSQADPAPHGCSASPLFVSPGLLFQAHSGKCLRAPSVGAGPQSQAAWACAGARVAGAAFGKCLPSFLVSSTNQGGKCCLPCRESLGLQPRRLTNPLAQRKSAVASISPHRFLTALRWLWSAMQQSKCL